MRNLPQKKYLLRANKDEYPHPGMCREHLNSYLCSRDLSPVRSQLQMSWQDASDGTKRYYVRKAGQGLSSLVQDIAPTDAGSPYKAVRSSEVVERTLDLVKDDNLTDIVDETMMNALAECYRAADDSWGTRRQILSIMADKLTLNQLRRWIPDRYLSQPSAIAWFSEEACLYTQHRRLE